MLIGELAKHTGLAASRIRFYEASGLIKPTERKANGYRYYGPDALWILEIIANAQNAGFSLDEIRALLPVGPGTWKHDELLDGLKRKVEEIEQLQKRLAKNKKQLLNAIQTIESQPQDIECADRTQRVLDRLRASKG
ncbi:MerR family transcriptional regulator [Duganella sp. CY15W]|uniref:MerR family transcriptional regulator n=1 Tax=Duganella sp. CY15W TaxID=2692172 RepID=UPI001371658E|nr:MerR family transcriptional regulator [Duganella sp. CY15W]MYM30230.1 MerR family transcriptional regulator [Duganella sp. CY15W]